jgi:5'-nucleotidase/UDP-sugar diphosphatase
MAGAVCLAAAVPEALLVIAGDQHSAYERTAQVVATVDRLKAEHPGLPLAILLNGDTLEYGNVVARRSAGAVDFAMFAALARRAPTIVNVGNHEPEFYDLTETIARLRATGVTVVCNITNRATGQPFCPAVAKLRLGGDEFTVVGVTTDNLATYRVAVRPALDLADPVVWAQRNFPTLLRGGAPAIVLSHAGIKADRGLMPLVPAGTLFAGRTTTSVSSTRLPTGSTSTRARGTNT